MTRIQQTYFPAEADSLSPMRCWAARLLSSTAKQDELCAQAVLVLSELGADLLARLKDDVEPKDAEVWAYISLDIATIGLGSVCETLLLDPPPRTDPIAGQRRRILNTFADGHGTLGNGFLTTRWAELRWSPPKVPVRHLINSATRKAANPTGRTLRPPRDAA